MAWPQAPWPFPNLPTYFGMSWLRRIAIVCVGVSVVKYEGQGQGQSGRVIKLFQITLVPDSLYAPRKISFTFLFTHVFHPR